MTAPSIPDSERLRRVLDAALAVFARHGFRKTSMDDVARAADISRQGLYFAFGDKEGLFRAALTKMMEDGLSAVDAALAADAAIADRLIKAMTIWYGRSVGTLGEGAEDLMARSFALLGDSMERYGDAVLDRLTLAIAASPLSASLAARGASPADAARTLHYCGLGLKHEPIAREAFRARLQAAVRLVVG
jgi:AcrR family transcriptional regulator